MTEGKLIGNAALRTLEALWGSYAFLMAGCLAGAVGRHPDLQAAISNEAGYKLFVRWNGDAGYVDIAELLLLVFVFVAFCQLILQKTGHCEPGDGMDLGRRIVRNFLIPILIGAASFAIGVAGGETWSNVYLSLAVLGLVFVFATAWHYWNDSTDPTI